MLLQNLMWVCTRHCLFLKTTLLILRSVHHVLFVKALTAFPEFAVEGSDLVLFERR